MITKNGIEREIKCRIKKQAVIKNLKNASML